MKALGTEMNSAAAPSLLCELARLFPCCGLSDLYLTVSRTENSFDTESDEGAETVVHNYFGFQLVLCS